MPKLWSPTSGVTWNSGANWTPTGVPTTGDDVDLTRDWGTSGLITVDKVGGPGNVASILYNDTAPNTGTLTLGGSSTTSAGQSWTLTAATTINVASTGPSYLGYINGLTGTGKITKSGPGMFHIYTASATTTFSGGFDVTGGALTYGGLVNKLGTGQLKFWNNTTINALETGLTVGNSVVFDAEMLNWYISSWDSPVTTGYSYGLFATTLKGPINFTTATGVVTVNVSNSGSASAAFGGAVTSSRGFIKAGQGTLTLSAANPNLLGTVSVSAGGLQNTDVGSLTNATIEVAGGTYTVGITGSTVGNLAGSSGTVATTTLNLTTGNLNADASFSADITGTSGTLTKAGTGTWTLGSTLSRTAATAITAGKVHLSVPDALSNSSVVTVGTSTTLLTNNNTSSAYRASLKALTLQSGSTVVFGPPA